jgi:hypothetical protein
VRAQMPNDSAAEKAGSAEHDDGAIVRCQHDSSSPIHVGSNGPPDAVGRPPLAIDSLLVRQADYAELSELGRYYIGGLLTHAVAVDRTCVMDSFHVGNNVLA